MPDDPQEEWSYMTDLGPVLVALFILAVVLLGIASFAVLLFFDVISLPEISLPTIAGNDLLVFSLMLGLLVLWSRTFGK